MRVLSARVRDFQSIADATVTFGDFTVLVGPSNSGKSGFLRGIRACLRNTAIPAYVRQGTIKSLVTVELADATVEIERGKSLSTYRLTRGQATETFTKSGRAVPDEIAKVIRFPLIEGVDATFAFQFDKPFLLSEPGSQAAQVIGSLTNVSMLHTAVREANRRRQEAVGVRKVREADIIRLSNQAREFTGLKERKAALDNAEDLLTQARVADGKMLDLTHALNTARLAQFILNDLAATEPSDVTSQVSEVSDLNQRLAQIETLLSRTTALAAALQTIAAQARFQRTAAAKLEDEHTEYLRVLGTCPTCGATTAS